MTIHICLATLYDSSFPLKNPAKYLRSIWGLLQDLQCLLICYAPKTHAYASFLQRNFPILALCHSKGLVDFADY